MSNEVYRSVQLGLQYKHRGGGARTCMRCQAAQCDTSIFVIDYYYSLPPALIGLKDDRGLSVWTRLACGAAAGTTGQTVAYPFDVARRRLQVCARARCMVWVYRCKCACAHCVAGSVLLILRPLLCMVCPIDVARRRLQVRVHMLCGICL
jgi:hypothetical protein